MFGSKTKVARSQPNRPTLAAKRAEKLPSASIPRTLLFNSVQFLVFLAIVLVLTAVVRGRRGQNSLLLAASYVFYGAWDWRFLGLIAASTIIDFLAAQGIEKAATKAGRRRWLLLSLTANLGLLGFFKYANFGIDSMATLLDGLGFEAHLPTLSIILPVGISFYTFQTISYTVDVYRGQRGAVKSLLDFALYVAFFPQLVAGPIERSTTLLPQLQKPRRATPEDWQVGLTWIALGYFYKVVLADTIAPLVEHAFRADAAVTAPVLWLGAVGFAVQVYGDFAGYSLLARGVARLFGVQLMRNFKSPYLALSPGDFWRRWHITLSFWFRDYVYIPLGGSRQGRWRTQFNLLLTMTLAGLWHGAGWNFVLWGVYNGLALNLQNLLTSQRPTDAPSPSWFSRVAKMVLTFTWLCAGFLIFLSSDLAHLGLILRDALTTWSWSSDAAFYLPKILTALAVLLAFQTWEEITGDDAPIRRWPAWAQVGAFTFLVACVVMVGFRPQPFIYFQF